MEAAGIENPVATKRKLGFLTINRGFDRGCGDLDLTTQDPQKLPKTRFIEDLSRTQFYDTGVPWERSWPHALDHFQVETCLRSNRSQFKLRELIADRDEVVFAFDKGLDHCGIEMFSALRQDDAAGNIVGERFLIDSFGGEGVVHVGQRHHATTKWNRLTLQTARISTSVETFVVRQGNLAGHL